MRFNNIEDDEKNEDFFENTPDPQQKKPKEPPIPRDDPRYWENDEDEWEHLRISTPRAKKLIIVGSVVAFIAFIWITLAWMFGTTAEESVVYGYVEDVHKQGSVFKTYEAVLLPYKEIHDTTRSYKSDFEFSLSDQDGKILQTYRDSGKPVKVTYTTYRAKMPWRGETKKLVTRIDTVNIATILPAEFDANPTRKPINNIQPKSTPDK